MNAVNIRLPYPPTVNHMYRSTANGQRYKVASAAKWAEDAAWLVCQAMAGKPPIDEPFILSVVVHRLDNKKRDLDNLSKAVCDALEAGKACTNDTLAHVTFWRWAGYGVGLSFHSAAVHMPIVNVEIGESAQ